MSSALRWSPQETPVNVVAAGPCACARGEGTACSENEQNWKERRAPLQSESLESASHRHVELHPHFLLELHSLLCSPAVQEHCWSFFPICFNLHQNQEHSICSC